MNDDDNSCGYYFYRLISVTIRQHDMGFSFSLVLTFGCVFTGFWDFWEGAARAHCFYNFFFIILCCIMLHPASFSFGVSS